MAKRAVIWDMDGVLVDTAQAHFTAWRLLCRRRGRDLSEEQFRATFGQRNREIVHALFGQAVDGQQALALADEKEELFRAAVGQVALLPGAAALLAALHEAGFRQAIGSSAPRRNIALLTQALGIASCFDAVVGEEDVREGKPSPEIFLTAAERLAIEPGRCLVIEDAVAGVAAAKAAGMACLAVTTTREREALREADFVVRSLAEVDVATVEQLIGAGRAGRVE